MSKSVKELSRDQLLELKQNYMYRDLEEDEVDDTGEYDSWDDIPDRVIFEKYGYIGFVNDDFSCSSGLSDDEYDKRGNLSELFLDIMNIINDIAYDFEDRKTISFDEALEQIKAEVLEYEREVG